MENVKVRTTRIGERLAHPTGALADNDGGVWPADQFTARRLRDKDVERIPDKSEPVVVDLPAKKKEPR